MPSTITRTSLATAAVLLSAGLAGAQVPETIPPGILSDSADEAEEPLPERREPAVHVGVGIALGVLNLPSLGAGPTVYVQIAPPGWLPIELIGTYYLDNEAALSPHERVLELHPELPLIFPADVTRIALQTTELSAAVCPYERQLKGGKMFLCGGAYGGLIHAQGEDFVLRDGSETRGLFGLQVYLRWRFAIAGPVQFTYSAGLTVPIIRDRFGYEDRFGGFQELFRATPVGGRLDLLIVTGF